MSDHNKQEALLMAIEYLKIQYESLHCSAHFPILSFTFKFKCCQKQAKKLRQTLKILAYLPYKQPKAFPKNSKSV